MRKILQVFTVGALLAIGIGQASADGNMSTFFSNGSCAGAECNSRTVAGSLTGRNVSGAAASRIVMPWVTQIWAEANECLRLTAVKLEGGNLLRMVVIAPDGTTIRRTLNAGVNQSQIILPSTGPQVGRTGFWTVIVNERAGAASEGEFSFVFGRYALGNRDNCQEDPTQYVVK